MAQTSSNHAVVDDPSFVSLGMLVLDELRFPSREPLLNIPGGSGAYGQDISTVPPHFFTFANTDQAFAATLGARLVTTRPRSKKIGCIVLAGHDFPEKVLSTLQDWEVTLLVHQETARPSTRGLLVYEDDAFGRKSFTYTTSPLQPAPSHLDPRSLLRVNSFHILASPDDLESRVSALLELRQRHGITPRPLLVWEPAPPGCEKVNLDAHLRACKLVDVFSPNHLELGCLLDGRTEAPPAFDKTALETSAKAFLDSGIGPRGEGVVVIRAGEHGCLLLSAAGSQWLPPFYNASSPEVMDPTGAGNAFLGALTVTLQATGDIREASILATVAASFALEQFGLPQLSTATSSTEEIWNGTSVPRRIEEYRSWLL